MNRETLIKVIEEALGFDPELISDNTNFREDLGADSLDAIELVCCIEEETGIDILDKEIEGLKTLSDVIGLLKRKKVWEE
jgi:acyl carrier protein